MRSDLFADYSVSLSFRSHRHTNCSDVWRRSCSNRSCGGRRFPTIGGVAAKGKAWETAVLPSTEKKMDSEASI